MNVKIMKELIIQYKTEDDKIEIRFNTEGMNLEELMLINQKMNEFINRELDKIDEEITVDFMKTAWKQIKKL